MTALVFKSDGNRLLVHTSKGIQRLFGIDVMLGAEVRYLTTWRRRWPRWRRQSGADSAVLGWGAKPSGQRGRDLARRWQMPFLALEDGFLRSFGTGDRFPPLSLVLDPVGIYYDSTRPSALEQLLNSDANLLSGREQPVQEAIELILRHHLSKYNHAPVLRSGALPQKKPGGRVLVVDQTAGDLSVSLGAADAATFAVMLDAARAENPGAVVYVKTHPETVQGSKGGYLTQVRPDARTVLLRESMNPLSLIEQMDRVYVVSSTMGFEALLAGKPVTCFGLPWYAGWGATDDRQVCARRTRRRSVAELFAAAYWDYSRYLNPVTHVRGTIFDVIGWLAHQRRMAGL